MRSAVSSLHRRHQRTRPFARSAGNWNVESNHDGGEPTYGCFEIIRLVLRIWCKGSSIGVYEVVMRCLVRVGKVCLQSLRLRE